MIRPSGSRGEVQACPAPKDDPTHASYHLMRAVNHVTHTRLAGFLLAIVLLFVWTPLSYARNLEGKDGATASIKGAWTPPGGASASTHARGGTSKQYIIFTDCDEDDTMAITIMAIQQALYNDVEILGIVVEDGFLSVDQGLLWLSFWMQSLFPQLQIPLIRGYTREPYLNQTRNFPTIWVAEYTQLLTAYYPAWSSTTPVAMSPEQFVKSLLSSTKTRGPYYVLSIGPTTTLPKLLGLYPAFRKRIVYGAFDLGSITPHIIYPGMPTPNTIVDTTWNAFMNPDGLAQAVQYMGQKKDQALAMTTDKCTAASVVNNATIALLESTGNAYVASGASPGSVFYYNATMGFLTNVVLNLGFLERSPVSLWDAVTALILLGVQIDQTLIKNLPVTITWTGNTNFYPLKERRKCRRVAQVYDRMDPQLFFQQFITLIFKPLSGIAS